jgi:hypothetical protein
MEPYWNEVRMSQMIGRAIRGCSHKNLPMNERHVEVFRYKVYKNKNRVNELIELAKETNSKENQQIRMRTDLSIYTTDHYLENVAREKNTLNESFLTLLKQAAVDCVLFKNHNMMNQEYKCFQFSEKVLFNKNPGPAYKDYVKDDIKLDDGLNSGNASIESVKVRKIFAVIKKAENNYSEKLPCWYYEKSGIVYDYDLYYPIGRILLDNGLPAKLDNDTYIITDVIEIP